MKIWHLDCDVDNFENLILKDKEDLELLKSFDGRNLKEGWVPAKVDRMYNREFSDSLGFASHVPVFGKKAIDLLYDLIKDNVEILPLDYTEEFYAINVTSVLDCIDYDKAIFKTFRDGKRVMRFTEYAFDPEKICEKNIFKICEEPLKRPFVSDEFRNKILNSQLSGFKFELVWETSYEKSS